jgi:RecB family endonuclease NucS
MEDLIAAFPGDFFHGKKLILKDRQKSFHGVGRFDLLFEDEFQRNILMELKARPARMEDTDQLVRYRDELVRLGVKNLLMWLVAPQIPRSMREFLDRFGIQYTEIHEVDFCDVAERHQIALDSVPEDREIAMSSS